MIELHDHEVLELNRYNVREHSPGSDENGFFPRYYLAQSQNGKLTLGAETSDCQLILFHCCKFTALLCIYMGIILIREIIERITAGSPMVGTPIILVRRPIR